MKHHSELLNLLIEFRLMQSYIEIGTFDRSHNFDKIKCEKKICVDPDPKAKADFVGTSDDFFRLMDNIPDSIAEIYWIDGMHTAEQVKKDFENALKHLSPGGFICLHDCLPPTEKTTCIPRGAQREWCGSTYKFACTLSEYPEIDFCTVDFDYGCCVVWRNYSQKSTQIGNVDWQRFEKEKNKLLRVVSVDKFKEIKHHRTWNNPKPFYKS